MWKEPNNLWATPAVPAVFRSFPRGPWVWGTHFQVFARMNVTICEGHLEVWGNGCSRLDALVWWPWQSSYPPADPTLLPWGREWPFLTNLDVCLHCRTVLAKPQHCSQNHSWLSSRPAQAWTGQTLLLQQSQTLLPSSRTHSCCHLKLHLLSFSVSCVLTPHEFKDGLEIILI